MITTLAGADEPPRPEPFTTTWTWALTTTAAALPGYPVLSSPAPATITAAPPPTVVWFSL